ncbi:MAG: hypothetical protein QOH81_532 [Sphingomonadales bacterium]|nr:hypothetical protein [Sphingomonadales bacterium]
MATRPLWHCPRCGRSFANRNQSHSCGLGELDRHFERTSLEMRRIYEAFLAMLESFGPVTTCRRRPGSPFMSACPSPS